MIFTGNWQHCKFTVCMIFQKMIEANDNKLLIILHQINMK